MAQSFIPKMWGEDKGGDVFSNLHRQIDRVFDDFTHGSHWPFPVAASGNGKLTPRVDVSETDTEIEVTAELPGVEEEQIDVNLTGDLLTIKAEKKSQEENLRFRPAKSPGCQRGTGRTRKTRAVRAGQSSEVITSVGWPKKPVQ